MPRAAWLAITCGLFPHSPIFSDPGRAVSKDKASIEKPMLDKLQAATSGGAGVLSRGVAWRQKRDKVAMAAGGSSPNLKLAGLHLCLARLPAGVIQGLLQLPQVLGRRQAGRCRSEAVMHAPGGGARRGDTDHQGLPGGWIGVGPWMRSKGGGGHIGCWADWRAEAAEGAC